MRFFFYGTLIEPEILHAVLNRTVHPALRRNGVLHGYRRVYRRGASYPVLVADAASEVEGIVVSALTPPDVALLTDYEGAEYEIRELRVRMSGDGLIRAKVFMPRSACQASCVPWTPEEWRRRYGRTFVRRFVRHCRAAAAAWACGLTDAGSIRRDVGVRHRPL